MLMSSQKYMDEFSYIIRCNPNILQEYEAIKERDKEAEKNQTEEEAKR